MKVIICGAGQVGFGIAQRLSSEHNDVTVIDSSPELIQSISDSLDVQGFVGHGAHPDHLQKAGAEEADMIIAVTSIDEINMVACQVAHSLFNIPTKIARIRAQNYLSPQWQDLFTQDNMPIDVIISPEVAVGESILKQLAVPGAFESISFADGLITVLGVTCKDDCPILDTPLKQLTELFPDLSAVVVGISREGRLFVPHSDDQMLSGDDVYIIADSTQVERTLAIFGHQERQARKIVIAGGGNIGNYVAKKLEERQSRTKVKIIESDRKRAIKIADELSRTVILHGDALDPEIMLEAGIAEADTFVALTNQDQVNILACIMAKRIGSDRTLSLVSNSDLSSMIRSVGIDGFISPRGTTISTILQYVRRGRIRGVHSIQNGLAEVLEAEALETSPLIGQPLSEVGLPDGMRIGGVVRDEKVLIPDGKMQIKKGDRIVIFALADQVSVVEQMFRVSLEFF